MVSQFSLINNLGHVLVRVSAAVKSYHEHGNSNKGKHCTAWLTFSEVWSIMIMGWHGSMQADMEPAGSPTPWLMGKIFLTGRGLSIFETSPSQCQTSSHRLHLLRVPPLWGAVFFQTTTESILLWYRCVKERKESVLSPSDHIRQRISSC